MRCAFCDFVLQCAVLCRDVWCWCCCVVRSVCVCVCVFCVLSVCGRGLARGKKNLCYVQNVPVCTFKTSQCVPAPRPHAFQHVDVVLAHTGTF